MYKLVLIIRDSYYDKWGDDEYCKMLDASMEFTHIEDVAAYARGKELTPWNCHLQTTVEETKGIRLHRKIEYDIYDCDKAMRLYIL